MGEEWIIGFSISVVGCFASALGVNLQKLAHTKHLEAGVDAGSVYGNPWWIGGIALVVAGSLCDVAAFGFASMSLLAPLGSLTLVLNMMSAPVFLGEKLSRKDIYATVVIVVGTTLGIVFASKAEINYTISMLGDLYSAAPFIVYACLASVGLIVTFYQLREIESRKETNDMTDADEEFEKWAFPLLAGVFGAHSVMFCKSTIEALKVSFSGNNQFVYFATYVFIVLLLGCLFLQMRLLNEGLARAEALFVVPVYQVCWVIMNTIVGLMYFQDYKAMSATAGVMFAVGTIITVVGVYWLSMKEKGVDGDDAAFMRKSIMGGGVGIEASPSSKNKRMSTIAKAGADGAATSSDGESSPRSRRFSSAVLMPEERAKQAKSRRLTMIVGFHVIETEVHETIQEEEDEVGAAGDSASAAPLDNARQLSQEEVDAATVEVTVEN